jgi:hypothetical protein
VDADCHSRFTQKQRLQIFAAVASVTSVVRVLSSCTVNGHSIVHLRHADKAILGKATRCETCTRYHHISTPCKRLNSPKSLIVLVLGRHSLQSEPTRGSNSGFFLFTKKRNGIGTDILSAVSLSSVSNHAEQRVVGQRAICKTVPCRYYWPEDWSTDKLLWKHVHGASVVVPWLPHQPIVCDVPSSGLSAKCNMTLSPPHIASYAEN